MSETTEWEPPEGRRWTAIDGQKMRAALARSALSEPAFARRHSVALHRVRYWRDKAKPKAAAFVPVREAAAAGTPPAARTEKRVELRLPDGVRVSLHGDWEISAVVRCVRELGASQ